MKQIRILLVEDNPMDAELAVRELNRSDLNCQVSKTDSWSGFARSLVEFVPDVIISDYSLVGFDGMDVLKLTRKVDELLPVIIITGSINEETAVKCIKSGAQDYILKENLKRLPFAVTDALEMRRIILERNSAENALRESQTQLEMFFSQSLDGFFFMMVDAPVFWNDQVEKDEVFEYIYNNQRITRINQAMLDQYGAQPGDMLDKTPEDFFKHDPEQGRKAWRKLLDDGHLHIDTLEKRMDGTMMWIEGEYSCMYDTEGRFLGHFGLQRDVTENKRAQDSLKKQLVALTQPLDDPEGIDFFDLFNIDDVQRIQDEFAEATGVSSLITRPDGTPLTRPTNFCRLCMEIIRKTEKGLANCIHSDAFIGMSRRDGPVIQPCLSGGLWDAGASIMVGGKHVANWLIGQVRNEAQDDEKLLLYADEIGADRDEFKAALAEVPVMPDEQFAKISKALYTIANELSLKAYQNIQQARFIREKGETEAALRTSELKYRSLIQYSSDPIFSFNPDETYRFVNEAFAAPFGKTPEDIIGRAPSDIFPKEEAEKRLSLVRKVFQTGEQGSVDVKVVTKEGEVRYYTTMVDPIKDASGNVMWVSCISKNITERKLAEEELIKAKEKAEESDLLKSAFLANMSHEIRTPMNSIIGFAELLTEEEIDTASRMKFAKLIESGSEQLLSLINDIIDISKIEAGQLTLNPVKVGIHDLVEEIYHMFSAIRIRMGRHNIELKIAFDEIGSQEVVFADRNRLRQVLINLGQNALKFTDAGSVVFGCQPGGCDSLKFFVRDTGIGIPPAKQDLIFKRFRQVEDTYNQTSRGTGLGLAISKNLVIMMGGEIGVESEVGKGSEFWFTIPHLPRH